MSLSKSTDGKVDSTLKLEYNQLVQGAIIMLKSFQERVCSLADTYLDTSVPYSLQIKDKLMLLCELVRYFVNCSM